MTNTVEIISKDLKSRHYGAVLFDFDGTLSLLRRNWQGVMIPQMVEALMATGSGESEQEIRELVKEFVTRLTGKQTIYQMIRLAEEVEQRGGSPLDPLDYKREYLDRLWEKIGGQVEACRNGEVAPEEMVVAGSHELLKRITAARIPMYLASGTDEQYVLDEVAVLKLDSYFGQHVYGALDDYKKFSKAMIIERIVRDMNVPGEQILGFGDGYVEIEEVKKVGGLAVGVASNEDEGRGIDHWKRQRLVDAGADLIVADYRCLDDLCTTLGWS
jgi:phosphoglycolate phosphatase